MQIHQSTQLHFRLTAHVLSLVPLIKPSEYGMHALATPLLDHSNGTQVRSCQLHSLLMARASSLAPLIRPSEYGMHALATPLLDHSKGTQIGSGRLHSLPMACALSLAPLIRPSEYGMHALVMLLLKTLLTKLLYYLIIYTVMFYLWTNSHLSKMDGSPLIMFSFFGYQPTFIPSCPILVIHLLLVLKAPHSLIIIAVFALVRFGPTVIFPNLDDFISCIYEVVALAVSFQLTSQHVRWQAFNF